VTVLMHRSVRQSAHWPGGQSAHGLDSPCAAVQRERRRSRTASPSSARAFVRVTALRCC